MLIATGTLLVLCSWAIAAGGLAAIGAPLSALTHDGPISLDDARRGAWWGLLLVTIAAYLVNLVAPLGSSGAALVLVGLVVVGVLATGTVIKGRGWHGRPGFDGPAWLILAGAAAAVAYLAIAALGPVTNYDSGLYHLGAVRYAADYATIPGLANLFFPFGYANAEFPLAGLLQNGPWGPEGYRLLNGLVIALVVVDLLLRSLTRRGAGFFVLLAGTTVLLVPMVALSDYWVTSPSQDSSVFAVTVAASALLSDAVSRRRHWEAEAAAAVATAILLVLLRPTMAAFTLCVVLVAVGLRVRRRAGRSGRWRHATVVVLVVGAAAAGAALLRDYVLSGWVQYPLSVFHFDVPWLAPDPVNERLATLGYHRDPTDLWAAVDGWSWVAPWLKRLPEQWETYLLACLLVAVLVLAIAARVTDVRVRWRGLVVCLAPSAVMTVVWWVATPPSFRFAWGPVFTLLTIPSGWLLWRLRGPVRAPRMGWLWLAAASIALPVLAVTAFSLATRLDVAEMTQARDWTLGVTIPYAVAPPTEPQTSRVPLRGDLTVVVPVEGEQCWAVFPLCTPRPDPEIGYLEDGIQGGLGLTRQAGL